MAAEGFLERVERTGADVAEDSWRRADVKAAMTINERLTPLHEALFCESSPGPVKFATSLLGHCQSDVRLPLCEIADASKQKVQRALSAAGLMN